MKLASAALLASNLSVYRDDILFNPRPNCSISGTIYPHFPLSTSGYIALKLIELHRYKKEISVAGHFGFLTMGTIFGVNRHSAMFGKARETSKRVVCANCTMSLSVSGGMSLFY